MRCTPNVDNYRTWFVSARRDEVDDDDDDRTVR